MPMTMTQKILAAHAGLKEVTAGQLIEARLDLVLGNDVTTPVAVKEFEKLATAPASEAPPMIYGALTGSHLREDVAFKSVDRETLLKNAPEQHAGYFVVPSAID